MTNIYSTEVGISPTLSRRGRGRDEVGPVGDIAGRPERTEGTGEDWRVVRDPRERRRLQNRANARAHREFILCSRIRGFCSLTRR